MYYGGHITGTNKIVLGLELNEGTVTRTFYILMKTKKNPCIVPSLWDTSPFRGNQVRVHT